MRLVNSDPTGSTHQKNETTAVGRERGDQTAIALPDSGSLAAADRAAAIEHQLEASLMLPTNSSLTWRVAADFAKIGVRIESIDTWSDSDLARILGIIEGASIPASSRDIVSALTKCDVVTKASSMADQDAKGRMAVFCEDLAEFSADAIEAAFAKHRRMEKWRPTVSEIRERCQDEMRFRRSIKSELEREQKKRRMK